MRSSFCCVLSLLSLALLGCPSAPQNPANPPAAEVTNSENPPPQTPPAASAAVGEVAVPTDVANPALQAGLLTAEEVNDGWIALYDGHSLFGWEPDVEGVNWHLEDGAIVADTGPIGLLMTTVNYANFELVVDYTMAAAGNSGVFLRTADTHSAAATDFYEVNIADSHPDKFMTASIVNRIHADKEIVGSGGRHTLRMIAEGNRIKVFFDAEQVVDYIDTTAGFRSTGRIGLQKNAGKIAFHKVVLKPLGLEPLIDGEGLAHWRQVPGALSKFENAGGELRVTNGPGFLETEETWANFVLQGQARTNDAGLNSGIFFRAMPGTQEVPSNGYEFQIHNAATAGDLTKPVDSGTGAIFRRIPARRVVGKDNEWVNITLVADGPRFATFVDGYQVVDWEDTRPARENPREGLRLEAGHLSLQGHDATTDVTFRNLRIGEVDTQ